MIAIADVSLLDFGDMFNIGSLFSGRGLDVQLKCFPVAHIGRDELEIGNRVILPPSILEHLSRASTPSPMLFEVLDLDEVKSQLLLC